VVLLWPFYGISIGTLMSLFLAFRERTEMPYMVAFGLACCVLGGALAEPELRDTDDRRNLFIIVTCALGFAGTYLSTMSLESQHKATSPLTFNTENTVHMLNQDFAGSVVLLQPGGGLWLESLSPLEVTDLRFHPVELGWNTFSPRFYQEIAALGIDHGYQLMDTLIDNKSAVELGAPWWGTVMLNMATARPGSTIKAVPIRQINNALYLFRYEEDRKP
ncbi:MAG: hypothetical protein ACHQAZ_08635, partial [Gammaproteobacteria bacterium]